MLKRLEREHCHEEAGILEILRINFKGGILI